jgi:hypothetical protein
MIPPYGGRFYRLPIFNPNIFFIMIKQYLFIIALLLPCLAWSQLSQPGTPPSDRHRLGTKIPTIEMPGIDIAALLQEDEEDLKSNLPLRFAYGFRVDYNMTDHGRWKPLPDGGRVWQLSIECPGALNINFLYKDFYLPPGSELYIYNRDKSQVLGAFTHLNNKATRRFASALIHDDIATLEYYEPAGTNGQPSIVLEQVAHGYRSLDGKPAPTRAGACQVNVNCPEGDNWQNEKKGVARIVMDGLFLCSGSLVNNTASNCKPYFLTANHCIDGGIKQDAIFNPDVSGYIFYWNYEFPGCSQSGPLPEQTTSGGTVIANSGVTQVYTTISSDFALIELAENPRDQYDVFFNGWDATGMPGNTGVGIHHPAGDDKKISTHSVTPTDDGNFWALFWDATPNGHAVTEGGSSGSPLFRESGRVIGQLFGGSSLNCDDPANDLGLYGKMSHSWTNPDDPMSFDSRRRLDVWLDPIGGGTILTTDGEYNPCQSPKVYFSSTTTTVQESAASNSNDCIGFQDYTVQLNITPFPSAPVDVFVSASGSATESVDFMLLNDQVTFNNVTNSQTITVRVFDDAYVESAETIALSFTTAGSFGVQAYPLIPQHTHTLTILSEDETPQAAGAHVQSVRNTINPAEAHLGPHGKVFFFDPGSGGIMLSIENLTSHDYGCTEVMVDKAGATANNSYQTGSTTGKSFFVNPANNQPNGQFKITLYYTDSEIDGWTWFNHQNDTPDNLKVIQFEGNASPANEGSASTAPTMAGGYGDDFTYTASFTGSLAGFSLGNLSGNSGFAPGHSSTGNAQGFLQASASPNPTTDRLTVEWQASELNDGQITLMGINGQVYHREPIAAAGYGRTTLDMSQLPAGVYIVRINNGLQLRESLRVVKM